jgi:hypothetical protein
VSAIATFVFAGACSSGHATAPTPTTNTPPTIESLVADSPIVEVTGDQSIQLTATVSDSETAPALLQYLWSATPATGTFVGSGPQVRWTPTAATPDSFTVTLTVVDAYTSGATAKEHRIQKTVDVRYHDMIIGGLVGQFLTDFGTFELSPAQCVRNFSDACPGKAEELEQIIEERRDVHIESAASSIASIVYTTPTFAHIDAPCTFVDNVATTTGHCLLTAIYDDLHWWLCESHYSDFVVMPRAIVQPEGWRKGWRKRGAVVVERSGRWHDADGRERRIAPVRLVVRQREAEPEARARTAATAAPRPSRLRTPA